MVDASTVAGWTYSYSDVGGGAIRGHSWLLDADNTIRVVYAVSDITEGNQTKYNVYFSTEDAAFTSVGSQNLEQGDLTGLPASGDDLLP